MAMTVSLLEAFKMYGNYCQQHGRGQGEAYLAKVGCDAATAEGIRSMFNDKGKLVDPKTKKPLGLGDLMGMSNLI